jgi:hypothetical protein
VKEGAGCPIPGECGLVISHQGGSKMRYLPTLPQGGPRRFSVHAGSQSVGICWGQAVPGFMPGVVSGRMSPGPLPHSRHRGHVGL